MILKGLERQKRLSAVFMRLQRKFPRLKELTECLSDDELIGLLDEIEATSLTPATPMETLKRIVDSRHPDWKFAVSTLNYDGSSQVFPTRQDAEESCFRLLWQMLLICEVAERFDPQETELEDWLEKQHTLIQNPGVGPTSVRPK